MPNPNNQTNPNAPSPQGDKSQIPPTSIDPSAFADAVAGLGPQIIPKGNFPQGSPEYFQDYVDRRLGKDSGGAQQIIDMGLAQPPSPDLQNVNLESLGALPGFTFTGGDIPTLNVQGGGGGGDGNGPPINTYGLSGTYNQTAPNVFTQPAPTLNPVNFTQGSQSNK